MKFLIISVDGDKFFVSATLHYISFMHHADFVCISDCGKSMGDYDGCSCRCKSVECFLYDLFRLGVESGGRLVKNQERRILEYCPGDAYSLSLAS